MEVTLREVDTLQEEDSVEVTHREDQATSKLE
jgi:hypothetical protein